MTGVYSIIFLLVDAPEGAMLFEIQKEKKKETLSNLSMKYSDNVYGV